MAFSPDTKIVITYYGKGKYDFNKNFEYRSMAGFRHYIMDKSSERHRHAEKNVSKPKCAITH